MGLLSETAANNVLNAPTTNPVIDENTAHLANTFRL